MTTTPNLALTQYATSDKINWVNEYNKDMLNIDTAVATKANQTSLDATNAIVAQIENEKISHNEPNSIPLEMFTTEAKTAMTGGSVAVIGHESVNLPQFNTTIQDLISAWISQILTVTTGDYDISNDVAFYESSASWKCAVFTVTEGQRFKVSTYILNATMYGVIFTDDSLNVKSKTLKGTGTGTTYTDYEVTTPVGATKLIINVNSSSITPKMKRLDFTSIASREHVSDYTDNTINTVDIVTDSIGFWKENDITIQTGEYDVVNGVAVFCSSASWLYTIINVRQYDIYKVSTLMINASVYGIIFTDDSLNVLATYFKGTGTSVTYTDYEVKVPAGATKLIVNSNSTSYNPKVKQYVYDVINYNDLLKHVDFDNTIMSFNRLGYRLNGAPEQSKVAFIEAKKQGFNTLECDLRFTSDGIPVCLHDDNINRVARNADGTSITSTVYIASTTYNDALTYDFGISSGSAYAGTPILIFEDMVKLCKNLGCNLYVEIKTVEQLASAVALVKKYGMSKKTWWYISSSYQLGVIKAADQYTNLCLMCLSSCTTADVDTAISLKTSNNKVAIYAYLSVITADLTSVFDYAIQNNVEVHAGTLNSKTTIDSTLETYPQIVAVESDYYNVGRVLLENLIN